MRHAEHVEQLAAKHLARAGMELPGVDRRAEAELRPVATNHRRAERGGERQVIARDRGRAGVDEIRQSFQVGGIAGPAVTASGDEDAQPGDEADRLAVCLGLDAGDPLPVRQQAADPMAGKARDLPLDQRCFGENADQAGAECEEILRPALFQQRGLLCRVEVRAVELVMGKADAIVGARHEAVAPVAERLAGKRGLEHAAGGDGAGSLRIEDVRIAGHDIEGNARPAIEARRIAHRGQHAEAQTPVGKAVLAFGIGKIGRPCLDAVALAEAGYPAQAAAVGGAAADEGRGFQQEDREPEMPRPDRGGETAEPGPDADHVMAVGGFGHGSRPRQDR